MFHSKLGNRYKTSVIKYLHSIKIVDCNYFTKVMTLFPNPTAELKLKYLKLNGVLTNLYEIHNNTPLSTVISSVTNYL